MKRRKAEDFFTDLALIIADDFFEDCDRLTRKAALEAQRIERYNVRRSKNAIKARRVYQRFIRVMQFDPWKATSHIKPDVFGDTHDRIDAVKVLANKKLRISWVLWAMYHWWMFDELAPGSKRYGKRYSAYRRLWFRYYELTQERLKQERWDRKRERVRARRTKTKFTKKGHKRTAEETLEILKKVSVQDVITFAEPINELPGMDSRPVTVFICGPKYDKGELSQ